MTPFYESMPPVFGQSLDNQSSVCSLDNDMLVLLKSLSERMDMVDRLMAAFTSISNSTLQPSDRPTPVSNNVSRSGSNFAISGPAETSVTPIRVRDASFVNRTESFVMLPMFYMPKSLETRHGMAHNGY